VHVPTKGQKRVRQEGVAHGEGESEDTEEEARRKRNKTDQRRLQDQSEGVTGSEDSLVEEDMDLEIEGYASPEALAVVRVIDTSDVHAHIFADYHSHAVFI
jgi:hypothetical protein